MNRPIVSVVIPAFNAEQSIEIAVSSVIDQTLSDLEIVVVDDGSSDRTADVVNSFQNSSIRLISQQNQGQSTAINNGVNRARGSFIKLLDADDRLNPEHIESQLGALNGATDKVASCRWGYFVNDHDQAVVRDELSNRDYDDPMEWAVDSLTKDEGMMGGWMWLIPRNLWDKSGGFDPRLSLNNDFHFSINLLLASNGVRFARNAIYSYRKGIDGALSASAGREAMESAYLTTEMGTQLLLEREDSPRIRRICADRFQLWAYRFYPQFPDLFVEAENYIQQLGGSELLMQGGKILNLLLPIIGWKGVRRLQTVAYRSGWAAMLKYKEKKRSAELAN